MSMLLLFPGGAGSEAPANSPPTVNAGSDLSVILGNSAYIDGASVSDTDGPSISYLWSKQSGPVGDGITGETTLNPTITFASVGTYVYRLTADDSVDTAYDELTIYVTEASSEKTRWRRMVDLKSFYNRRFRR